VKTLKVLKFQIGRGPSFHSHLRAIMSMDWMGLAPELVELLSRTYKSPLLLQGAFDNLAEADQLIRQIAGEAIDDSKLERLANQLSIWGSVNKVRFKRARREIVRRCHEQSVRSAASQSSKAVQDAYDNLSRQQIVFVKSRHKSTLSNVLGEEPDPKHREDLEERERSHWVKVLAQFMIDGGLPIVATIESTANPGEAWKGLFGRRRAKTLRNRARTFRHFIDWLFNAKGRIYPSGVVDALDYIEQLAGVDAGKTVVDSLAASLSLVETLGGVEEKDMITKQKLFQESCKFWKVKMGQSNTTVKKAEIFFVSMLIALELVVTDTQVVDYCRAMAWLLLVMHWACVRMDDVIGIDITRLSITDVALRGVLTRTKTSGPGRQVVELPFFVSRKATLAGVDWVRMGFLIWKSDEWSFKRDYFPLSPNKSQEGPTNKPCPPALMQSIFLGILAKLRVPKRPTTLAGWRESEEEDMLIPENLVFFWTGHSARHWLPSVATAMGYGKDLVDYVGRWGAGQHQSRDYVVTARQVVLSVQEGVVEALCTGSKPYDELDLELGFKAWASNREFLREEDFKLLALLKSSATGSWCLMQDFPNFKVNPWYGPTAEAAPLPIADEETQKDSSSTGSSSSRPAESPFWVSITGRSGFRRLHKRNAPSCAVMPWNCRKVVDLWEISPDVADAICKSCKPSIQFTANKSEAKTGDSGSESSSSGSSSSVSREELTHPVQQLPAGTEESWAVTAPNDDSEQIDLTES
jgi:hypothetical protein